jgi:NTE family protein
MGADIIIAVDIGTPLGKSQSLQSLGGVLGQMLGVIMTENQRRAVDKNLHPKLQVVVKPNLKQYGTFSFSQQATIIQLGYQGAQAMANELLPYAVSEEEYQAYLREKSSKIRKAIPVPQFVEVVGTSDKGRESIEKDLKKALVGKEIQTQYIKEQLDEIWGRGRFAGLSYELTEKNGQDGLLIRVREKGYAPPFLNVGVELNNTETDVFDFNLRARATILDVGKYGSEWRIDGSLGSRIFFGTEFYYPLGNTHFFAAPYASYDRTKSGVFREEDEIAQYKVTRKNLGVDLGYTFGDTSEVRFGYQIADETASIDIGAPVLPSADGSLSEMRFRWAYEGVDSPIVPTRGTRVRSELRYFFDVPEENGVAVESDFPQGEIRVGSFFPFGKKSTLFALGDGGTSFDNNSPVLEKFTLGGLVRLGAFSTNEFRGDHLLYGSGGYLWHFAQMPPLLGEKISFIFFYEVGSVFDDWDLADVHHSGNVGLIAETLAGPVFIGGSIGDGGRSNFYFALGRFF